MKHNAAQILALVLAGTLTPFGAARAVPDPVVLGTAVQTITMSRGSAFAGVSAMSIAYHPIYKQYYGANGGNSSNSGFVWNESGTRLQTQTPVGLDCRGINYNPATGNIEVVTFGAKTATAGSMYGLYVLDLTVAGLQTGTATQSLQQVPGLSDNQCVPSYDPARNRLYSRSSNVSQNTVNLVDRFTGSLLGTVVLDTTGLGAPSLQSYSLGFDPANEVFITFEPSRRRALVHRLNGTFLAGSTIPGTFTSGGDYDLSYANGQLFLFDGAANQYVGFRIFQATNATISTAARKYALVSWPVAATDTSVSGTIVPQLGAADTLVWRLGHWLPDRGAYSMAGAFYAADGRQLSGIHPDKGYWLITKDAKTVHVSGYPAPNGYEIPLQSGPGGAAAWSQLGSHFRTASPVSAILVRQGSSMFRLTNPMQSLTDRVVWTWNGTAYVQQGDGGTIPANGGFWVKKQSSGSVNIVLFRDIPAPAPGLTSEPAPTLWDVAITAHQGEMSSNLLTLGAANVDVVRWNSMAIALPPAPPGNTLRLVVKKTDWGDKNDDYASEYRPPSETMTWDFVLSGSEGPGEIELWFAGRALPAGVRLGLTDLGSETTWEVNPGSALSLAAMRSERRLRLTATRSQGGLQGNAVTRFRAYPNPFSGSTGLAFSLAQPGDIVADLYDVQGRVVRRLERLGALAGESVMLWDGRDRRGRAVANGVYFARYRAGTASGVRRLVKAE
jgi:hypothetical protein